MSLLDKIFTAGRVLRAGESLQNPAAWKNVQSLANILLVFVGAIPVYTSVILNEEQVNAASYGLAILIAGVYNTYFTVATTDKIGLPIKAKSK